MRPHFARLPEAKNKLDHFEVPPPWIIEKIKKKAPLVEDRPTVQIHDDMPARYEQWRREQEKKPPVEDGGRGVVVFEL